MHFCKTASNSINLLITVRFSLLNIRWKKKIFRISTFLFNSMCSEFQETFWKRDVIRETFWKIKMFMLYKVCVNEIFQLIWINGEYSKWSWIYRLYFLFVYSIYICHSVFKKNVILFITDIDNSEIYINI